MFGLCVLAAGFTPLQPARSAVAARASVVASAADIVSGWQPAALARIVNEIGLTPKDYPADLGYDSFTLAGASGKIESFEGPGQPNVAWCSGLQLSSDGEARGSIAVFCGPLTDVPHLVVQCGLSDNRVLEERIEVYIDYRPRAESGYDPSLASLADYPAPETREAFAEGGNRKDFAAAFFTEEAEAAKAALLAIPGAEVEAPLSKEKCSEISAGPLLVDIKLPATEDAAVAAADACTAAVDRWLNWMATAEENKRGLPAGMRQTATYTRDTKVRTNHFGFLLGRYTNLYGEEDGKALATADAGPLDEAYVGGGS